MSISSHCKPIKTPLNMFSSIFLHELRYWLRRPTTYIYFVVFFAMVFLSFAGTAGWFDPAPETSEETATLNSALAINTILKFFGKLFLFLLPAIVGVGLYRDYKQQSHSILYSFPLRKTDYLLGKFLGAFVVVVLIASSAGLAMALAEQLPGLHPENIGPFSAGAYAQAYFVYLLPNLFWVGLLVFVVVLLTRNVYAGFVVPVLAILLQSILENAFTGQPYLIALTDPFAANTVQYLTWTWTVAEQNLNALPLASVVWFNRLLWVGLATVLFLFAYRRFAFAEQAPFDFSRKGKRSHIKDAVTRVYEPVSPESYAFNYSVREGLKTCLKMSRFHLRFITRNIVFLAIAVLCIAMLALLLAKVVHTGDMTMRPVTGLILSVPTNLYTSIVILLTFVFSAMLIHRDRTAGINQLVDATAIPNWVLMGSRFLAIIKMQVLLLLLLMLTGITLQLINGHWQLDLGLYAFHLFVIIFSKLIVWAMTAFLVHTLITNTYLGIFTLVIGWIGIGGLEEIGITSHLLVYNKAPELHHSDLSGFGPALKGFAMVQGYWLCLGAILIVLSYLLWQRGLPNHFRERLALARARFSRPIVMFAGSMLLVFGIFGFTIWQEETKAEAVNGKAYGEAMANFEARFGAYSSLSQPKITSIRMQVDLYPETQSFKASGRYQMVNRTNAPLDTLLIKSGFDEETSFTMDRPYQVIDEDSLIQFAVLKLDQALAPGDSLTLDFEVRNKPNLALQRNSNVLSNGTFLLQDFMPRFGYFLNTNQRQPEDATACQHNYQAHDADLLDFEAVVSTSGDQEAFAPGTLEEEWTEAGRRYFRYHMHHPTKFSLGFNSGRFAMAAGESGGVKTAVYHHPDHDYNVESMLGGLEAALAYNAEHFGACTHEEVRILEFPHSEGTYATAFGNNLPISEMRFIAQVDDVHLSFYAPMHELTHHWWGNQLMPADALGAHLLTESFTEYVCLQIYREQFGQERKEWLIEKHRDHYLQGRAKDHAEEPPLVRLSGEQRYLSYAKGALAMHTMSHHLGEAELNAILKSFLEQYKFQGPPYPTSLDWVAHLKQETPDSLNQLISELFEQVILHDYRLSAASVRADEDGRFEVECSIVAGKESFSEGVSSPLRLNDWLEVGVYDQDGTLLHTERVHIDQKEGTYQFTLEASPSSLMLDPNVLVLEKDRKDNRFVLQ